MKRIWRLLLSLCLCMGLFIPFSAVLLTVTASAKSDTDIAYSVSGGNVYFDAETGTLTDCDESVTTAVIPAQISGATVRKIESQAFRDCVNLTSVTIPESVTEIADDAFGDCKSLTSVRIPASVTEIGVNLFYGCEKLSSIDVASGNPAYCDVNGVLFDKQQTRLISYPIGKRETAYAIPESVARIEHYAFQGATLASVTIPQSVTEIGWYAFLVCKNLTSVKIPDGVSVLEDGVFASCVALERVSLPESLQTIGYYAFDGDTKLKTINIPESVTFIGGYAFCNCASLTNIHIPGNLTEAGSYLFAGSGLVSAYIPDNVRLGSCAFTECVNLVNVRLPENHNIGLQMFSGCTSLTSLRIAKGASSISYSAFGNCSGLKSVSIPDSVTKIWSGAFSGCANLTDVYYSGNKAQWDAIEIQRNNDELLAATIHYNSSVPEVAFSFPSAPTVSGGAGITRANVGTLTEITVPVAYSGNTAQTVTFAVPFYDGSGKFIGVGMKTETVTSSTQSVTVPVSGLSGSESMKVMILGDTFNPLSPVGSYSLPS